MSVDSLQPLDDVGARLVQGALAEVATYGFADASLRAMADRAGCTTGAVAARFGNRAQLVAAATREALASETRFHEEIGSAARLAVDSRSATDLICHYVRRHSVRDEARLFFWAMAAEGPAPLTRWHAVRTRFLLDLLARVGGGERADRLASVVLLEGYYAAALPRSDLHAMLMAETIRTHLGDTPETHAASVAESLNEQPGDRPTTTSGGTPVRERLLRSAADGILDHGVSALTRRSAARFAGASPSAITYHFGDMERFMDAAIWSALLRDIPAVLDPAVPPPTRPKSLREWLERLVPLLLSRTPDAPAGFYTRFARITGQMCLLAATRPGLQPLAEHLRALEGWGTARAGRALSAAAPLRRDHAAAFAIWIKGDAILRDAGVIDRQVSTNDLVTAARAVFPSG